MINQPWGADGYSPLDFSLLDRHFGNIQDWRDAITEIHRRDMYAVLDTTVSTMGDLIGFNGYMNSTTPFKMQGHRVSWKTNKRYADFSFSNQYDMRCKYPRFYQESGHPVTPKSSTGERLNGCYYGDFDQYGDTEAFGVFPDWQRQLSKFASVQDRLKEWNPNVLKRIAHFACLEIFMLDIDGLRVDKATQITVDALSDWSSIVRGCAREVGKNNFFIPGEITGGNTFGSIYLGRGRLNSKKSQAKDAQASYDISSGAEVGKKPDPKYFIREEGKNALDAGAFHYTVYRALTRFLWMDGQLSAGYDAPSNWVDMWNTMLVTNDLINAETGKLDPRHMYGVTNQDVFRWPAIKDGEHRMILGLFVTTLLMPGIPKLLWGEEQEMYVLDNTANNYIFGRQAMSSTQAWQIHGCYALPNSTQYWRFPVDKALRGCHDDWNSLDHRDPSSEAHNTIKSMYNLRKIFPVLNDGLFLESLSNLTENFYLPGSNHTPTETGIWSISRGPWEKRQDFTGNAKGNQMVWLVFTNQNSSKEFEFDCSDTEKGLYAPYQKGTVMQNLFFPYDEYTLGGSSKTIWVDSVKKKRGCLEKMFMPAWGFKALVPKEDFVANKPSITKFTPGHDARILSKVPSGKPQLLDISITFTEDMDCQGLKSAISFSSTTEKPNEKISIKSWMCKQIPESNRDLPRLVGAPQGTWKFTATLENVYDGIHTLTVQNATASDGKGQMMATDHFLFRVGSLDNPIVFPKAANYTSKLLFRDPVSKRLVFSHRAAGADMYRYSTNWASSWSEWREYHQGGKIFINPLPWSGTKKQTWEGDHVIMQYWSQKAGSSDHIQHSDTNSEPARRFPHMYLHGPFNIFGYDAGIPNAMHRYGNGEWRFDLTAEWPTRFQFNVWGMNPDRKPDSSFVYCDVNNDGIIDRMPPAYLGECMVNVTHSPPKGYLSFRVILNDGTLKYKFTPAGSTTIQIIIYVAMLTTPIFTGFLAVYVFMVGFYRVKTNERGAGRARSSLTSMLTFGKNCDVMMPGERPCVLIATLEYYIEDWDIKLKIGGLGVMAKLMGDSLRHQDLIWVIPCVGGIEYPVDTPAGTISCTILGDEYVVYVQTHVVKNITYVLLDAPIFRKQSKAEPYPARMDDIESAIFYSAWNQCIAVVLERFPIDLYHINDYHGALAPIHILPNTIPCVLSLHNAEFQGLWKMRTPEEKAEVCSVFNITPELCQKYVQYGDVFNLLHAGASYLRIHQKGYGAVGVSAKYGKRSKARYPIFWGLSNVGQLPNPDPEDTAEFDPDHRDTGEVTVNQEFEAARGELKRQAQEWAGLRQDPSAELLVFVGRWSVQKGIDLIADVMPALLNENKNLQLLCVGPVIDLYGRFAALKLQKLVQMYPGRVFSRPEYTQLPQYIFSGADFALIPSRDEPFGLVAVEFGRKGALGIGARVGGLGNMPGWWYTVESMTSLHLHTQFEDAIRKALTCPEDVRAKMRATSAKQRFPVQVWVQQLEKLQAGACAKRTSRGSSILSMALLGSGSACDLPGAIVSRAPSRMGDVDVDIPRRPSPLVLTQQTGNHETNVDIISPSETPVYMMPEGSRTPRPLPSPTRLNFFTSDNHLMPGPPTRSGVFDSTRSPSPLSTESVISDKLDLELSKCSENFTDSDWTYSNRFKEELEKLSSKNSKTKLCIEDYVKFSEKKWFSKVRMEKLGLALGANHSDTVLAIRNVASEPPPSSSGNDSSEVEQHRGPKEQPPTGLRLLMLRKIGDWPLYSFFLALGQIISANSYQITLLTDQVTMTADRLYIVCSIYLGASIIWWLVFRRFKAVWVLSVPFAIYGCAFLLVGLSILPPFLPRRELLGNIGTSLYAFASASGALYFALNFGDEAADTHSWVYRACVIQGTQQSYVIALWYWGSRLTSRTLDGAPSTVAPSPVIAMVIIPIACIFFLVSALLAYALPSYYYQLPGRIPSFYVALSRRNIVRWFFFAVLIQNYWLSAPYGRNWTYLWSSTYTPAWSIGVLVVIFFGVIWAAILILFARLTKAHSWILPVFAIGLGAPRWAQMLWATSNIGLSLPWAGSPAASAIISRSLWLWLGVLDAVQGVGLGMILLQTLTRMHVAFTLIGAQVLGSVATIAARATAPNREGPGEVFPDLCGYRWGEEGGEMWWTHWAFWTALLCQGLICVGYFKFFRKEQLSKP
ncbi:hypothetical protein EDC01DRAFT_690858 [Geopyxis carbonaria]|nr:hypothetical protein EDC01DRAFT_690858 [Geopyxis carbonaria]